jgi:hypothetical protein
MHICKSHILLIFVIFVHYVLYYQTGIRILRFRVTNQILIGCKGIYRWGAMSYVSYGALLTSRHICVIYNSRFELNYQCIVGWVRLEIGFLRMPPWPNG